MPTSTEVLAERNEALKERVNKLEANQRTGIVAIMMLVIKSAFDVISAGPL